MSGQREAFIYKLRAVVADAYKCLEANCDAPDRNADSYQTSRNVALYPFRKKMARLGIKKEDINP